MDVTVPPRLPLGVLPTPLVAADRLRAALGCDPVRLKRDDLAGFGGAGNKTRALEYLLGDAAAGGADVLVTRGGPDSNFVPAAALAARVAGLDCELVVWGSAVPDTGAPDSGRPGGTPNLDLAAAAGARIRALGDDPPTRGACGALDIVDARGPGFGVASPEDRAAAHLALRTGGAVAADIHTSGGA